MSDEHSVPFEELLRQMAAQDHGVLVRNERGGREYYSNETLAGTSGIVYQPRSTGRGVATSPQSTERPRSSFGADERSEPGRNDRVFVGDNSGSAVTFYNRPTAHPARPAPFASSIGPPGEGETGAIVRAVNPSLAMQLRAAKAFASLATTGSAGDDRLVDAQTEEQYLARILQAKDNLEQLEAILFDAASEGERARSRHSAAASPTTRESVQKETGPTSSKSDAHTTTPSVAPSEGDVNDGQSDDDKVTYTPEPSETGDGPDSRG
ncbi:uncharacterized protein I303_101677 [Kwoniella dejecticola CBS 10117]|uniref:Uncharacterized protein n=1 Tax=Kwoniella dejecticola CBS 10117 TaxID=1296121 RepID=A0A1A6AD35_9TREE|nr:uncharacterized protein I303_02187 [Kwoniella dejecticola CBS 10117]OBR87971.1 hypothetical protein I303_02187 [Kwoniella dejecticola CBS 10117]